MPLKFPLPLSGTCPRTLDPGVAAGAAFMQHTLVPLPFLPHQRGELRRFVRRSGARNGTRL